MPASGVSPPYSVPINLFRAFRIGEFTRGMPGANECACVGKFFSVDCAPLCVSSESVRFRTVLSDPEHTIRHLPVARPRTPAFQSRCPLHRKRESQHHVNGCCASRNRLPRSGPHTTGNRTVARWKLDRRRAYLCGAGLREEKTLCATKLSLI